MSKPEQGVGDLSPQRDTFQVPPFETGQPSASVEIARAAPRCRSDDEVQNAGEHRSKLLKKGLAAWGTALDSHIPSRRLLLRLGIRPATMQVSACQDFALSAHRSDSAVWLTDECPRKSCATDDQELKGAGDGRSTYYMRKSPIIGETEHHDILRL